MEQGARIIPERGDVYKADLGPPLPLKEGEPETGREEAYKRPVIILQERTYSTALSTVLVIPCTTSPPQDAWRATSVRLTRGTAGLDKDSYALCHQLRVMDKARLRDKLGVLPGEVLGVIEQRCASLLGLQLR